MGSTAAIKHKNVKVGLSRCYHHMERSDSVGWSHFTHQSSSLVLVAVDCLLNLKEPIYIMKFYTSSPGFRTKYQPYGQSFLRFLFHISLAHVLKK